MPAYRDGPHFHEAVASVLAQSQGDLELIVTDDSGGDLRATAESFDDPRVRYLPNPRRLGFAANHCRALGAAGGEYVALLHHDDRWEPGFLAATTAALDAHPDVGMVVVGAEDIDGAGASLGSRPARMPPGKQPDALELLLARDFMLMLPSLMIFRRRALEANRRPWPDNNIADVTMYLDVAKRGWKMFYVAEMLAQYRNHPEQASVQTVRHRRDTAALWGSYRFKDPRHERLRRLRVAEALLSQAGIEVREGEPAEARRALRGAARLSPRSIGPRWVAIWLLSFIQGVAPGMHDRWTRVRDPVRERHRG